MEEKEVKVVVALTTEPKAERPEDQPPWLAKFTSTFTGTGEDGRAVDAFIKGLADQGYTHYMNLVRTPGKRVTIGTIDSEWAPLVAAAFFTREPTSDDFVALATGEVDEPVSVFEMRKAYSQMQTVGRGNACATLEPDEVAAWIEFFEFQPGSIKPISELTS